MYKNIIKGRKAVFFDLDGTIVKNTVDYGTKAVQKVFDDDLEASYLDANSYTFPGFTTNKKWGVITKLNKFKNPKSVEELTALTHKYYLEMIKESGVGVTEGFWDFLYEVKEEKQLKTVLTTNTPRSTAMATLELLGADKVFDLIICGDEVKRTKPDPEMYKKALKTLKIRPKEAVVFEDSVAGATSAAKANIDLVIIWDGTTPKNTYPGKILWFMPDFSDLPGKLDEDYMEYMTRRAEETKKGK